MDQGSLLLLGLGPLSRGGAQCGRGEGLCPISGGPEKGFHPRSGSRSAAGQPARADVCFLIYARFWEGRWGASCVSPGGSTPSRRGSGEDGQRLFPVPARTSPEEASGRARHRPGLRLISWRGGLPQPEPSEPGITTPRSPISQVGKQVWLGLSLSPRGPRPHSSPTNGCFSPLRFSSASLLPPQSGTVLLSFCRRGKLRPRHS